MSEILTHVLIGDVCFYDWNYAFACDDSGDASVTTQRRKRLLVSPSSVFLFSPRSGCLSSPPSGCLSSPSSDRFPSTPPGCFPHRFRFSCPHSPYLGCPHRLWNVFRWSHLVCMYV